MSNQELFKGPLFIVGLSRSGTKLIRDLLNRNENILLPEIESHFIPKILTDTKLNTKTAYKKIKRTLFVKRYSDIKYPNLEILKQFSQLRRKTELIESILKYYALVGKEGWNNDTIWGDKTPLYLRSLDLLKTHFPTCKIIHIIRDPRDRALSVRRTWGKSMYRATEIMRKEIMDSIPWREKKDIYFEVKYEELIENPENILKQICHFLNVNFSKKMLNLSKPSEKHGKNSEKLEVNKNNKSKFLFENHNKIKRIEEIAYPIMKDLGYEIKFAKSFKPLSPILMTILRYTDHINFKISVKIKGY